MRVKRLSILGIALVLMGFFISGCSQEPDEADGWIWYMNEEYGYAFAYPRNCTLGTMPQDCKQVPPEERRQECLCFLNAENPDDVAMQAFLGERGSLALATLSVSHFDTPVYHPPEDAELLRWVREGFGEGFVDFPDEPNMEIDGVPAVRVYSPSSPMTPSFEEVYVFQNEVLLRITMLDVDKEDNKSLYDNVLASFDLEN